MVCHTYNAATFEFHLKEQQHGCNDTQCSPVPTLSNLGPTVLLDMFRLWLLLDSVSLRNACTRVRNELDRSLTQLNEIRLTRSSTIDRLIGDLANTCTAWGERASQKISYIINLLHWLMHTLNHTSFTWVAPRRFADFVLVFIKAFSDLTLSEPMLQVSEDIISHNAAHSSYRTGLILRLTFRISILKSCSRKLYISPSQYRLRASGCRIQRLKRFWVILSKSHWKSTIELRIFSATRRVWQVGERKSTPKEHLPTSNGKNAEWLGSSCHSLKVVTVQKVLALYLLPRTLGQGLT